MVRIGPREVLPALRVGPQRERTDQRRFQENQTERIRCPHDRLHIDNLSFRTSYKDIHSNEMHKQNYLF